MTVQEIFNTKAVQDLQTQRLLPRPHRINFNDNLPKQNYLNIAYYHFFSDLCHQQAEVGCIFAANMDGYETSHHYMSQTAEEKKMKQKLRFTSSFCPKCLDVQELCCIFALKDIEERKE